MEEPLLTEQGQSNDMESSQGQSSDTDQQPVVQEQRSFFMAALDGVNMLAGVGILSMPYAVSRGGWVGVIFLLIFALVCCYTGVLLRRCLDLFPGLRPHEAYPKLGEAACGRLGRILVSGVLYLELFAVAIEFLILEGDNLTQLTSLKRLDFGIFHLSSEKFFVFISALVMLPTAWLRDHIILSVGGVLACVTLLFTVVWIGIFDVGFKNTGHMQSLQGLRIAVGLYVFCYCGHGVFPKLYGSMSDKSKFSHVLIVCFVLSTLIYGVLGVLGFLMFGDGIKSQVTLNLPRGRLATRIAILATIVNPIAKYALTIKPLAEAAEEFLPTGLEAWRLVIWIVIVFATAVVALALPFFAYFMALVGSFLSTMVAIIIPCLCYMTLFWGRIPLWEMGCIVLFVATGLVACVAGTWSAVVEIARGLSTARSTNAAL